MAKLQSSDTQQAAQLGVQATKAAKYPMEDRVHQIKAEEFATKEERAEKLSPAAAARIRAKAKRLLGK